MKKIIALFLLWFSTSFICNKSWKTYNFVIKSGYRLEIGSGLFFDTSKIGDVIYMKHVGSNKGCYGKLKVLGKNELFSNMMFKNIETMDGRNCIQIRIDTSKQRFPILESDTIIISGIEYLR